MTKSDVRFFLVYTATVLGMVLGFTWAIGTYTDMVNAREEAARKAAESVCYYEVAKADGTNIPLAQAREEVPAPQTVNMKEIEYLADYQARLILATKKLEDVRLAKMLAGDLVTAADADAYVGFWKLLTTDLCEAIYALDASGLSEAEARIVDQNVARLGQQLLDVYNDIFPYVSLVETGTFEPVSEAMTAADMTVEPTTVPLLSEKDIAVVSHLADYGTRGVALQKCMDEAASDFAGTDQILVSKAWDDAGDAYIADKLAREQVIRELTESTIPPSLKKALLASVWKTSNAISAVALNIRDSATTPKPASRELTFENVRLFTSL